jgi:hypothetical protein
LLGVCKTIGLFIVPCGELESWWEGSPSDKNEWFIQAIEKLKNNPSGFKDVSNFVLSVCNYLNRCIDD